MSRLGRLGERFAGAIRSMYARPEARPAHVPRTRATAFRGAVQSRFTNDWILARIQSADAEVKGDLRTLRRRAREIVRNTPHAARYTGILRSQVLGPNGQTLQSMPRKLDGTIDRDAAAKIEEAWERWCEKETCTADGKLTFAEVERLALTSEAQDGEALVRMLPGFPNEFGFALQPLDPDQLDEEYNRGPEQGGNQIRMSVEVDQWGRSVAFHLFDHHPYDYQGWGRRDRIVVKAEDMIHAYQIRRPGQTRGVSWYAPVLLDEEMRQGLQEAELISSRIAATKAGVFEVEDPEMVVNPDSEAGGDLDFTWEMEPGVWETLPPGIKAKFIDPQHPNSAFNDFNKIILRSIASGLMTSYSSLGGDYSDVNYGSLRAASIEERDGYELIQSVQASSLNRVAFRRWLPWALTTGALDLPIENLRRYQRHSWQGRGYKWIDPLKDIQATELGIALGIDSRTRACRALGRDIEDVIAELKREKQLAEEAGVDISGAQKPETLPTGEDEEIAQRVSRASDRTLGKALDLMNGDRARLAKLLTGGHSR